MTDFRKDIVEYFEEKIAGKNLAKLDFTLFFDDIQKKLSKYSIDDINYTCLKLEEAGFMQCTQYINDRIDITNMTYNGHLFLDNIRDNNVWSTTKKVISKFSSVSLNIVEKVATQVITNLIQSSMK